MLCREYPPYVYGGGGTYLGSLVPRLRGMAEVDVHCFGDGGHEDAEHRHPVPGQLGGANLALQTLAVNAAMVAGCHDVDLVNSHTWYANMAGHLAKVQRGVPHVVTAHTLEPRRPWKAEQLAEGYRLSSWYEQVALLRADAVIVVSDWMRADLLSCYPAVEPARVSVVPLGVDAEHYRPVADRSTLARHGIDPGRPIVLFVGRLTRQKGVDQLIAAAPQIDARAQLVLCAVSPDTAEIVAETAAAVAELAASRPGVFWLRDFLPATEVRQLLSAATVFVCPSGYEPGGFVNLEAMACGVPVVAARVGGIPELVEDGQTGLLVPFDQHAVADFRGELAAAVNTLLNEPELAAKMGEAGRRRAVEAFSWASVANQTMQVYRTALAAPPA
jgi:starch synthase